jgi:outer membrane protein assembly factor BamA
MIRKLLLLILLLSTLSSIAQKPKSQKKGKEDKKVNYAFIPIIMYNKSFGMQFGAMANAYFDLNKNDTISPASSVAFYGNIFTNKTYFTGLMNKLYFNEDRWRTKFGLGLGNINFQTYFEFPPGIPGLPEGGEFVDYQTQIKFIYAEGIRLVVDRLYLGGRFVYSSVSTHFDADLIPDENLNLLGFGLASEYDKRDNVFNPHTGFNTKLNTFSFLEELGSSDTYHKIDLTYNKYFPLSDHATLLARFFADVSLGETVPFNGQNTVGRDDLRGYSNGKYRANQVYNIQSEYRWNFYKKWGMVAFGGIAIATDDFQGKNYSGLLPAVGAGLRFKAIPSRNINIGIDLAVGKGDWGIYFRIGEAFLR